ncbi:unnamed protein product, partial [Ostreobium quekettii]|eukprot:evm.model.scf_977.3 EVM.evm.TU.scf_977.3   scf_977:54996-56575(+)
MLDRSSVELLTLSVMFLKKLSIYKENKERMAECRVVEKLANFVPGGSDLLLAATLRLLHNLSFDGVLREAMVKCGLIPKAVALLGDLRFRHVVLGFLYHVSTDEENKSTFTYTDAMPK